MKRICVPIVLLLVLYLCVVPTIGKQAAAVDKIFDIPGAEIDSENPQITRTGGDGVNVIIPLSKSKEFAANTAAALLGPQNIIMSWFGQLKPHGAYKIITDELQQLADQIWGAGSVDLMPAKYQEKKIEDTSPKNLSMTSRLCVYNPTTGELVGNFISTSTMESDISSWGIPAAEGARVMASYTTRYALDNMDLRLPFVKVKKLAALPCGAKMDAEDFKQADKAYVKDNTYGDNGGTSGNVTNFIVDIVEGMIKAVTEIVKDPLTGEKTEQTRYKATVSVPSHIVGTGQDYPAHGVLCLTAGCDQTDLEPVAYPIDKTASDKAGGLVETYKPAVLSYTINNGSAADQEWDQNIAQGDPAAPNSNYALVGIKNSGEFMNCNLLPESMQKQYYPNGECDTSWTSVKSIPPNQTITSSKDKKPAQCQAAMKDFPTNLTPLTQAVTAATSGKIPSCVLQGVANNEGAAIEIASGKCSPNECSAAGPFQITVGFTFSTKNGQCSQDTSCKSCGLSSCPNAIKDYVPGTNPCDTESAAKAAVSMLIGKARYYGLALDTTGNPQAIIAAGDSYYGAAVPIARFGGCSYGEQVYKTCNSTYACRPHTLPAAGAKL